MAKDKQSVFLSYAWGGESEQIANEIESAFKNRGLSIIRDKKDLAYKGSIAAFEQRIAQGDCVIIVLSDKYLKSKHCMNELVLTAEHKEIRGRVFPIVLADAKIYDSLDLVEYVKYWQDKKDNLDRKMREVSLENLQGIREDLDLYARIRSAIAALTDLLNDMNTLTPEILAENDYRELFDAVEHAAPNHVQPPSQPNPGPSIIVGNISSSSGIAIGAGARASVTQFHDENASRIEKAFAVILDKVETLCEPDQQEDARDALLKLKEEALKGDQANETRIRKWLDFLVNCSQKIFDAASAIFNDPQNGFSSTFREVASDAAAGRP